MLSFLPKRTSEENTIYNEYLLHVRCYVSDSLPIFVSLTLKNNTVRQVLSSYFTHKSPVEAKYISVRMNPGLESKVYGFKVQCSF